VQELYEGTENTILRKNQISQLAFAEQLAAQANKLKPIKARDPTKASDKVKEYLQKKAEQDKVVKINPGMKRQITKMLSQRIEFSSSESDSSSDSK
jgi:hypothetical protein